MPRDDDDFEDRPRRRPWDDERGEDRPRRRRDDDDEDDRPRRRRDDDYEEDDFGDYDDRRGRRGRRMPREVLRGIAMNQKAIILCILVYLCLIPIQFAIPEESRFVLGLVAIPLLITAAVFTFLLAMKVSTTVTGVLLAVFVLIPCLGLIGLVIINQKAIAILREHGIHVGFLGANVSDI